MNNVYGGSSILVAIAYRQNIQKNIRIIVPIKGLNNDVLVFFKILSFIFNRIF